MTETVSRSDLIEQWKKALRSGKYEQSVGGLCTSSYDPKYCCLGVAAYAVLGIGPPILQSMGYLDENSANTLGLDMEVTQEEKYKLHSIVGMGDDLEATVTRHDVYVHANDAAKMSFEQIATMTEIMCWDKEENIA